MKLKRRREQRWKRKQKLCKSGKSGVRDCENEEPPRERGIGGGRAKNGRNLRSTQPHEEEKEGQKREGPTVQ